jgi:hypothetical protein
MSEKEREDQNTNSSPSRSASSSFLPRKRTAHNDKGDFRCLHSLFDVELIQSIDLREQSVLILCDVVVIVLCHLKESTKEGISNGRERDRKISITLSRCSRWSLRGTWHRQSSRRKSHSKKDENDK